MQVATDADKGAVHEAMEGEVLLQTTGAQFDSTTFDLPEVEEPDSKGHIADILEEVQWTSITIK